MYYRKRTIEVTVRLTVDEYVNDDLVKAKEQNNQFFWEENHCIGNELELLGEYIAKESEEDICNICRFTKVKMLPLDAEEGYRISVNEINLIKALE